MACCKAETATLVFGIFLAVISSIVAVLSLAGFLYIVVSIAFGSFTDVYYAYTGLWIFTANFSAISLIFCLILIIGVMKKKHALLKTFLIYASLVIVAGLTGTMVYIVCFDGREPSLLFSAFSVCAFHAIMLPIVRRAYLRILPQSSRIMRAAEDINLHLFVEHK